VIYFGSLLAGSLYSLSYHKKELYYSAVGASGAVSGIVYSCIMLYPEMQLGLILIPIPILVQSSEISYPCSTFFPDKTS